MQVAVAALLTSTRLLEAQVAQEVVVLEQFILLLLWQPQELQILVAAAGH